ncbi:MAG: YceD family protein [Bacilli bacterium]
MKINISSLSLKKPSIVMEDDVDLSNADFDPYHIKNIESCHVEAEVTFLSDDLYSLKLHIKGLAIVPCAYTLEDVDYPFDVKEELTYKVFYKDDEEDSSFYPITSSEIDVDEAVLSLVITSIPFKVIKKGAKLPKEGKGYRFLTEEEYLKEKEKKSSPFDVLDSLDVDK